MRPQRQQVFRTDAASKLDSVELVAALLVRDAAKGRAFIAERGVPLPPGNVRKRLLRRRRVDVAAKASKLARNIAMSIAYVARHPYLHGSVRAVYAFVVDVVIVLSTVGAAVAALTAAFVLA